MLTKWKLKSEVETKLNLVVIENLIVIISPSEYASLFKSLHMEVYKSTVSLMFLDDPTN